MHSLGFAHEHQRPDRNNFVNVYRTKMTSNCFEAFDIIPMDPTKRKSDSKYRVSSRMIHAGKIIHIHLVYDDKSIMHYGGSRKECRKFSEPYMTLKPSGREIPENKELSIIDIKTLRNFYAPPSKSSLNW